MNRLQEFFDSHDKVIFIEHYSWGIITSWWHADGRFKEYSLISIPENARL